MAVEIVRGAVGLVRFAHCGNFERCEDAVPRYVDNGDVHRVVIEEGLEPGQTEERLAGCNGRAHAIADVTQRFRVVEVDLESKEAEIVKPAADPKVALGIEVEIEVEKDAGVWPGALAECPQLRTQRVDDPLVGVKLGPAEATREARKMPWRVLAENKDFGLERPEPALPHLRAEFDKIVEPHDVPAVHHLGAVIGHPIGAAMRSVVRQFRAHRPAEKVVDRHAQ